MASPAFQESAFQNLTSHGIKGFQVTDSDTAGGGGGTGLYMWIHHHHHANGAWLLPFLLLLAACRGVPWWR